MCLPIAFMISYCRNKVWELLKFLPLSVTTLILVLDSDCLVSEQLQRQGKKLLKYVHKVCVKINCR